MKVIEKDKKTENKNANNSTVIKFNLYQKAKIKTLKGPQPRC